MRVLARAGLAASAVIVVAPGVLAAGEQHTAVSASAPAPAAAAAASTSTPISTVPIVLAVVGVACIVLSVSVGFYFYVRIRNPQLGTRLKPFSIFTRNGAKNKGSKMVIGEPELRFAPEHASHAIDLSTATAAEKVALSRGGKISTTLQRDAARATADLWNMPFSSSNETNSSGPAPRTSTESDHREVGKLNLRRPPSVARPADDQDQSQQLHASLRGTETDHMSRNEKRARRVAVPSTLLRSLGELPNIPNLASSTSGSSASDSSLESLDSVPRLAPIDKRDTKDNGSLTPVLNLSFDLDAPSMGSTIPFEDELDFEIQRSAWLTSTLSTAFDRIKVSPSNSAAAVTFEKPSAKGLLSTSSIGPLTRKGSIADARPSVDSKRSGAGSFMTSRADAESVYQSANSLATARTSNSINTKHTSVDSYAPPIPSIPSHMHVAINMPEMLNHRDSQIQRKSLGKPIEVPVKAVREVPPNAPQGGFRPLSLGLSLSSSSSSSIGNILFKASKQSFWSEAMQTDIESHDSSHGLKESSSVEKTSSSRKSSSSLSRSQASSSSSLPPSLPSKPMQLVSANNTSFSFNSGNSSGKTTSTLPSLMISDDSSVARSVDTTATSFTVANASAGAAETSGASATAIKSSPTIKEYNLDAKHAMARELAGNFVRSNSNSPKLSASAGSKFAFVTPYHRAVFPEAPQEEEEDREAEGQAGKRREDLLAQLAVGTKVASPKISFTEGLRARLTRHSPVLPPASPSLSTKQPSPNPETSTSSRANTRPDTMSTTASTSFGGPTEQWRISTEDNDDDLPPFLRGQGQERTGLGLTSRTQEVTARSSLVAVASNKADRGEYVARYNARHESPARTSMSISPIMQSSRWGMEREKTTASHLSRVAEDRENEEAEIDFRDLQTSITLGSSQSSPLDEVQRTLSRPPTRSSPVSSPVTTSSPKLATNRIRNSQQQQLRSPSSAQVSRMSTFSFASPRTDADTMSIASSCMSDTMGEGMEDAVDRRAKLLQSVQQSLAARTQREKVSSRLSYGESSPGFSASRSNLMSKTAAAAAAGSTQPLRKPANLVLKPSNVLPPHIISPLTPPETPADPKSPSGSSTMTIKMHATSSTVRSPLREGFAVSSSSSSSGSLASSASTSSDMTSKGGVPTVPRLRPLSLTAQASIFDEPSLQLISPISSPSPSHHPKDARARQQQQQMLYQERRLSRGLQLGAGGVLPPVASHAFSSAAAGSPRIGLAA